MNYENKVESLNQEIKKELEKVPNILKSLCKKAYGRECEFSINDFDIDVEFDYKKVVECQYLYTDGIYATGTTIKTCPAEEAQFIAVSLSIDDGEASEIYDISASVADISKDIVMQACDQLVYMME